MDMEFNKCTVTQDLINVVLTFHSHAYLSSNHSIDCLLEVARPQLHDRCQQNGGMEGQPAASGGLGGCLLDSVGTSLSLLPQTPTK